MNARTFLNHTVASVGSVPKPVAQCCVTIRCIINENDGGAAEIHHVGLNDTQKHHHERTDEYYYVLEGEGTMILDDQVLEIHKDTVIHIPRGVKHQAVGESLVALVITIPRGVFRDLHFDD